MKNILVILTAVFFFASCKKQLREEPKSIAAETFYNTAAEVEAGVNAIFGPIREPNCLSGVYPAQVETYGDYVYGRGSYAPLNEYAGLDNTNITRIGQMWDLFYRSIRNANLVIANAPNGTSLSDADKKRFLAEARFMRAFIYFQLVRNWGGVPLRTEANMTEKDIKRSTSTEVYKLIEGDLLAAETDLPDAAAQAGRPSKWSAKAMLTEVYLSLNRYTEAMDKSNEIVISNKYALVPVAAMADFEKVFGADVNSTPEEIFYLKFSRSGTNQGFYYVMIAHHPAAGYHGAGGFAVHHTDTVQNTFIKNWDFNDLRKSFNLYSWDIGLGKTSALFRKFKDPVAAGIFSAGNDYPFYKYSDVLLFYAEAASRANNGPTALAMERLNMVHRRAYGLSATAVSAIDFKLADYPTVQSFLDLVVKERGYETIYEAKRWHDLKRMGIAQQVIQQVKGKTLATKHLLWPIPLSEMNYNKALDPAKDQNPGY
jgi:hypothetical protein